MKVRVKWNISPRSIGIPRRPGSFSELEVKEAKRIIKEYPGIFESPELDKINEPKVKDAMAKKTYTRPVSR